MITLLAQIENPLISNLHRQIGVFPEQQDLLSRSLIDNPPMTVRDGGVIANGYDIELDELRALSTNASDFLLQLEQREREKTGISTLKVGYNRVHGYIIEFSRAQSANAPVVAFLFSISKYVNLKDAPNVIKDSPPAVD